MLVMRCECWRIDVSETVTAICNNRRRFEISSMCKVDGKSTAVLHFDVLGFEPEGNLIWKIILVTCFVLNGWNTKHRPITALGSSLSYYLYMCYLFKLVEQRKNTHDFIDSHNLSEKVMLVKFEDFGLFSLFEYKALATKYLIKFLVVMWGVLTPPPRIDAPVIKMPLEEGKQNKECFNHCPVVYGAADSDLNTPFL